MRPGRMMRTCASGASSVAEATTTAASDVHPEVLLKLLERENAQARIDESGPGAELLRRMYVGRLQSYMEAFYQHGSFADVVALCRALELSEENCANGTKHEAPVLEALLDMLEVRNGLSSRGE